MHQITKSRRTSAACLGAPRSTSWVLSSRTRAVLRLPCCFSRIFFALSEHDVDRWLGILAEPFLCNRDGGGRGRVSGATSAPWDSALRGGRWIYYHWNITTLIFKARHNLRAAPPLAVLPVTSDLKRPAPHGIRLPPAAPSPPPSQTAGEELGRALTRTICRRASDTPGRRPSVGVVCARTLW